MNEKQKKLVEQSRRIGSKIVEIGKLALTYSEAVKAVQAGLSDLAELQARADEQAARIASRRNEIDKLNNDISALLNGDTFDNKTAEKVAKLKNLVDVLQSRLAIEESRAHDYDIELDDSSLCVQEFTKLVAWRVYLLVEKQTRERLAPVMRGDALENAIRECDSVKLWQSRRSAHSDNVGARIALIQQILGDAELVMKGAA